MAGEGERVPPALPDGREKWRGEVRGYGLCIVTNDDADGPYAWVWDGGIGDWMSVPMADGPIFAAYAETMRARAEKAEAEVESWGGHSFAVQTELDAAWAAAEVPVRGMVPLAEVVAGFRDDRAALRAKVARLEKQIAAARSALDALTEEVPMADLTCCPRHRAHLPLVSDGAAIRCGDLDAADRQMLLEAAEDARADHADRAAHEGDIERALGSLYTLDEWNALPQTKCDLAWTTLRQLVAKRSGDVPALADALTEALEQLAAVTESRNYMREGAERYYDAFNAAADRVTELEKNLAAVTAERDAAEARGDAWKTKAAEHGAHVVEIRERDEMEAERDALRAQVARLEAGREDDAEARAALRRSKDVM
jgi:hypothetical protein